MEKDVLWKSSPCWISISQRPVCQAFSHVTTLLCIKLLERNNLVLLRRMTPPHNAWRNQILTVVEFITIF